MKTNNCILSIIAGLCLFLCGCGLSRSSAGSLISDHKDFKEDKKTVRIMTGTSPYSLTQNSDEIDQVLRAMRELGLAESNNSLTPSGVRESKSWHQEKDIFKGTLLAYDVPIGERELDEVTGLSEITNPMGSFMEAQFKWHWKPTTEIGKKTKLEDKSYEGKALLQKFDDGWRVTTIKF